MKLIKRAMIIPVASLLLLSGCATPPTREYADFAQAGSKYATAVDKLLDAAGKAQVDSTSWGIVDVKEKTGVVSEKKYRELTKIDEEHIEIIGKLQGHARLFGRYLKLLNELATSDAPGRTKTEIEGVIKGMAELSSRPVTPSPAVSAVAEIFVDASIRKELKDELIKRKHVILKELELQKELLATLGEQVSHALTLVKGTKEQQLLLVPLAVDGALAKPEEWVAKRRDIIYMEETAKELGTAQEVAEEMSNTFEALTTGKDVAGRINALIIDIERIVAVADALNS
jgi:hypothetical protein